MCNASGKHDYTPFFLQRTSNTQQIHCLLCYPSSSIALLNGNVLLACTKVHEIANITIRGLVKNERIMSQDTEPTFGNARVEEGKPQIFLALPCTLSDNCYYTLVPKQCRLHLRLAVQCTKRQKRNPLHRLAARCTKRNKRNLLLHPAARCIKSQLPTN